VDVRASVGKVCADVVSLETLEVGDWVVIGERAEGRGIDEDGE
jgi:hypothetical protein